MAKGTSLATPKLLEPGGFQQVRIRLPNDLAAKLSATDGPLNGRIVEGLRSYLDQRQNLEQIAKEAALSRAFATCFSVAETITGKPLDDPATMKIALSMIRTLVEKLDSEVKGKGGQPTAQRAMELLLGLAKLDEKTRAGFNAGLAVPAT